MLQDTLQVVADSLPVAVDTVKVVAQDSLVANAAQAIGNQVNAGIALVLGVLVKFVVDLAKKALASLDGAPALVKTAVASAFSLGATWLSGVVGFPINGDLGALETTLATLVVAGVSMGVHSVSKVLKK